VKLFIRLHMHPFRLADDENQHVRLVHDEMGFRCLRDETMVPFGYISPNPDVV
jgi:hypothetical protein